MLDLINVLKAHGLPVNTATKQLKIHLACYDQKFNPLDEFKAGRFANWQSHQTRRNFDCKQVIGLIDFDRIGGKDTWLFAGLFQVNGAAEPPNADHPDHYLYNTTLLPNQDDIIGRIVVHYRRTSRASYLWYEDAIKFPIDEIRAKPVSVKEFTGFANVLLMHADLQHIMQHAAPEWKMALSHTKGIYVITDTQSGKHYVGQAAGDGGFWQRWSNYAAAGHGNNVQLKALLNEQGAAHAAHFQYAILETMPIYTSDAEINAREQHWMRVLHTRTHGLN